jgi:PAS domain S-box-containing protein
LLKQLGGFGAQPPAQTGRLTGIFAIAAFGIALLALAGWLLDARFLAGQWGRAIPMSPSAALALLFLSGGVFSQARWSTRRLSHQISLVCVGISALLGVLVLAQFIVGFDLGVERALNRTNELFGQIPLGKMSPLTAGSLLFESGALLLLLRPTRWRHAGSTSALLALTAIAINLVVIVGYLYGAPLLYGGTTIPVAMPTALSFVLVGAGQTRLAVHSAPALRAWSGDSMRAILLGAFLPPMLLLILLEGWLDTLQPTLASNQALWHSGTALVACVLIATITAWTARRTGDAVERAEDALRESEETHRALVVGLPDIVMRFGRDGRHLFVSDNVHDMVDLQAAQFIGKTHRELGFPEAQCRFWEEAIRGVFDSGASFETEFMIEGRQGQSIYSCRLVPEYGAQGMVRSVLTLSRDITAHRRAEESYRTLFREMLDGFALHEILCDKDGRPTDYRFLAVNPSFERMTGLRAVDIVGKTVLEVLPGTELSWIETYGKVAITGEPAFFENYHAGLKKHFKVSAFRPAPNQFACMFVDTTEGKRANAALRQSEERYRALFDRSLDSVYLTDFEGHFLDANQAALDLLGYRFEDITMLTFGSLLTEDQVPKAMQTVEEILTTGRQQNPTEHRLRRKDGGHAFVETQASLIYRDAKPFAIQGIARDISERKRAEDALREGKEHYQSLIECLGEGVVSVSRQGRVLMANPAAEKIFGMSRGGAIGRELVEIVDPGDMPVLASERARRERGETSAFELRVTRPDGVKRTLRVTATPQYDVSGHFQSILAVIRDITEENVLLQRLRLLAHTLDSVDECVSICDPEDRLLFVNRAFLRTYGYEESNLIGENISIVRSPLNSPEVTGGILPGTLAGGWRGELWNRKKDGSDFQIMLNTAAVVDRDGRIEATVGVARDITERKRADAELTSARERAESANRAKSEFLAMMSHEIRTPMNGVIGMTGLLLDTPLTPEQRDYAETVRKSGDALLTVINDILDFSKIEAGRLQIEHFSFDLRLVIEEVNEMLAPKAEEHDLEFVLEYPSSLPQHFIGDGGRMRQVITNLVGNAVKFTPGGSVFVKVECVGQDTQTAHMRIAVHDTGVGIPPEKLDAIFSKFSQVDSTTTRKYGGTGLGLAISKQLIELMGGSIGVESRLGQGSEFSVILPLRQDPDPSTGADLTKLLGLRVLVVDDHEVYRRVLADLTTNWGMRCRSTASGEEALEALRAAQAGGDRYHFVILDYQMPGMDGATLASAIKAEPALQEVGVVMLSSIGQSPEVRSMEGTSVDAVLVKPVRQGELLSTLARIWGGVKADDRERRVPESKARWAGRFAGLGLRVLVAEDNAVNQKVAVLMLERLGLRADVASSGREAVDLREMIPYDLILMDCQMPEMDGYEATREIRRREGGRRRTAIVAMTAEAMTGAREQCIEAGMDDYIAKPARLEDMVEALQRWCLKGDEAGNPKSRRGQ